MSSIVDKIEDVVDDVWYWIKEWFITILIVIIFSSLITGAIWAVVYENKYEYVPCPEELTHSGIVFNVDGTIENNSNKIVAIECCYTDADILWIKTLEPNTRLKNVRMISNLGTLYGFIIYNSNGMPIDFVRFNSCKKLKE